MEFDDAAKFQDSFMINFEVSYLDMFGNEFKHELKEDGKNIMVTMENRQVRHIHIHMCSHVTCMSHVCHA